MEKAIELGILKLAKLAHERKLVIPPDVMVSYLQRELGANEEQTLKLSEQLEKRNLIQKITITAKPVNVGYELWDIDKKEISGYTITLQGLEVFKTYEKVMTHYFGIQLFRGK